MQSEFYPTIANTYGIQLDTRNLRTKSDWQMWTAAIASPSTRQLMIGKLAKWINETSAHRAFTDLYLVDTGDEDADFIARPVVGGHFALLALNGAPVARRGERMFRA